MERALSRFTLGFSTGVLVLAVILVGARGASAADLPGDTNSRISGEGPVKPDQAGAAQAVTPAPIVADDSATGGAIPGSQSAPLALTPGKKFNYFARSSFSPPTPYALSIASGLYAELTDKDNHRHMSGGDFLADTMTHAARSFAFRATANFFEKFAYASVFKQDPRYVRSDKKGIGRIGYALSRVVVTRSDGGKDQFNASFLGGGLTAAAISNAWSRPEDRTWSSTLGRFGTHVGYKALSNVIRELFGRR